MLCPRQLQSLQSDMSTVVDMVSSHHAPAQALCEHLDRVFMHGWVCSPITNSHTHTHAHRLRDSVCGYWPFVVYFTRSEAVQYLSSLSNVHLDIGRGVCVCVPPYLTLPCKDGPGCVCVCVCVPPYLTLPCRTSLVVYCTQ